jgi:antitoxin component of RelBE/YafQ-DinJ toxin-antitoxin module
MPKVGNRSVTLSVNADLWSRCTEIKKQHGVNLSQVCEMALTQLVETIAALEASLKDTGSIEPAVSELLLKFQRDYTFQMARMYEEIEELKAKSSESPSMSDQ